MMTSFSFFIAKQVTKMCTAKIRGTMEPSYDDKSTPSSQPKDLLRDGPCSEQHAVLQACQQRKNIIKPSNAMTFCVSETDLLIACVRKHPAHFHTAQMRK
jgi:spore germination cell wall hydrolase CwlJ-like protein